MSADLPMSGPAAWPSGAGKSTLISLLGGSRLADEGRVEVLGRDLARISARERRTLQRRLGTVASSSTSWASCAWSTT